VAKVLVLDAPVPFTFGGQDVLIASLILQLKSRGHETAHVSVPFIVQEKKDLSHQATFWRSLNLNKITGSATDYVIATKFPTYLAKHDCKSIWLVHQHRPIYDLYGGAYSDFSPHPEDELLRRELMDLDIKAFTEASFFGAISNTVKDRVVRYCGLTPQTLYPPLKLTFPANRDGDTTPYILSVGRICGIKRLDLLIKAMPNIHEFVQLKIVGLPDEPHIMEYLKNEIAKHHLEHRVTFLGRVGDLELLDLYSNSLAVYYAPHLEDYGYVTLEAFAAGKSVVTAIDSGGVLEFVEDNHTGLVALPESHSIAEAFNKLIADKDLRSRLENNALKRVMDLNLHDESSWDTIISLLLP
jgi:glycosyltransferase involved in cell wall biosynthesis